MKYLVLIFLLVCSAASQARIYKCHSESGKVKFQQTPCDQNELGLVYENNSQQDLTSITKIDVGYLKQAAKQASIDNKAELTEFLKQFGLKKQQPAPYVPNREQWQHNIIRITLYGNKVQEWLYRPLDGYLLKQGRHQKLNQFYLPDNPQAFERILKLLLPAR